MLFSKANKGKGS